MPREMKIFKCMVERTSFAGRSILAQTICVFICNARLLDYYAADGLAAYVLVNDLQLLSYVEPGCSCFVKSAVV